jgi:hypothetical protein
MHELSLDKPKRGRPKKQPENEMPSLHPPPLKNSTLQERAYSFVLYYPSPLSAYLAAGSTEFAEGDSISMVWRKLFAKKQIFFQGTPAKGDLAFVALNGKLTEVWMIDKLDPFQNKLFVVKPGVQPAQFHELTSWHSYGRIER